MHCDLDSLDNFVDNDPDGGIYDDDPLHTLPYTNGSSSVVVPMDDMELILTQMWKSRQTEPKMGELYEKYKTLLTFDN